ncbi:MAG: MBOAT family protein [Sandaracinaceae bacterium]
MLFNSLDYVLFFALVFVAYWGLVRGERASLARPLDRDRRVQALLLRTARIVLLLVASYAFYMSWSSIFIVLVVFSTLLDYGVGLGLGRARHPWVRRALVGVSLAGNLGLLGLFKYADFAQVAARDVMAPLGVTLHPQLLDLVLPVGISFYTFQTLSYTIDVYRRRIEPSRSLLEFATYVAFFPQLVAGPIVRAKEFLPQFTRTPQLDAGQASSAVYLILRGMVKKVAVADFLAVSIIDRAFDNPGAFSSAEMWLGVYAYTWQLYGDFSGYTDIARGSARLLGFELPENFDRPFNTTGPMEFWRRWHMTLSRWVMDYLYIPLGGNRGSPARAYVNLFLAFLIIGIWHGAGWPYILFGLWHAVGVTLNRYYRHWREARGLSSAPPDGGIKRVALVMICFAYFLLQWPVFRSPSLERMGEVYGRLFAGDWLSLRASPWVFVVVAGMTFLHFCPRAWVDTAEQRLRTLPWPLMGVLVALVAALLLRVSAGQPAPFIYFQF